ncbi:MAG: PIG-L family deacetylase [Acidobacteriota bacterium]|jgi:LmbE family N-acetylglucosaminyl deacetylase
MTSPSRTTFVPDGEPEETALRRISHLGIGAHQDDLEIIAYHGIARCYGDGHRWFGGITCTDGAGSPRAGAFAGFSDEQMIAARRAEQEEAARLGEYGVMVQLGYPSAAIKSDAGQRELEDDLVGLLERMAPRVVYTHALTDRHDTHVAVALAALGALRRLPAGVRPQRVYGCEAWRDLDWLLDEDAVVLDVGAHPELAERLVGVFASQIAGGKRYDLAAPGRRRANATFRSSHDIDDLEQAWLAMDMTPLIAFDGPRPEEWVESLLERFAADVTERLHRHTREDAQD